MIFDLSYNSLELFVDVKMYADVRIFFSEELNTSSA